MTTFLKISMCMGIFAGIWTGSYAMGCSGGMGSGGGHDHGSGSSGDHSEMSGTNHDTHGNTSDKTNHSSHAAPVQENQNFDEFSIDQAHLNMAYTNYRRQPL